MSMTSDRANRPAKAERPGPLQWLESIALLLPVRIVLGATFLFAAWLKVTDTQSFAESISAFRILPDHLTVIAAFVVPWTEVVVGLALIFGAWTRAAGLLLTVQLFVFTAAILSAIGREMELSCGCFGDYEFPCKSPIGWCHVARNTTLLLMSLLITIRGGGLLSVDAWLRKRRAERAAAG